MQTFIPFLQLDRWKVSQSFANQVDVLKKGDLREVSVFFVWKYGVFSYLSCLLREHLVFAFCFSSFSDEIH